MSCERSHYLLVGLAHHLNNKFRNKICIVPRKPANLKWQIMFKVGMGDSPPTPESLSKEGAEFLEMCLEHDPRQRATATDLLAHPFLKVRPFAGTFSLAVS